MLLTTRNHRPNIDRLFQDLWSPIATETKEDFFSPRVDIKDTGDSFEIYAEVPGVKKEDISIAILKGVLSLEAENKKESPQEDTKENTGKVIRQERRYGKIVRNFTVGENVNETEISASLEDGILKVVVPKAQPQKPEPRSIPIQ